MSDIADSKGPISLPYCEFPNASQVSLHGQQSLPEELPLAKWDAVAPYRSIKYRLTKISDLNHTQLLQMARGVGEGFARREPMSRYLQLPTVMPKSLVDQKHTDPFGTDAFGEWSYTNLIYWFIRLFMLTDPTQPEPITTLNTSILDLSYAILDEKGEVIGGTFSEPLAPPDEPEPAFRSDDPFLSAAMLGLGPILDLLTEQNVTGMQILSETYPDVKRAWMQGEMVHHFMLARFEGLPTNDTTELLFGLYEQYQREGYKYVIAESTNQWTGAGFDAMGSVRTFFTPFRTVKRVKESKTGLPNDVTTPDGYIAGIDSGSMFYIQRLN